MPIPAYEEFCSRVCAHVRFKPARAAISAELTAHMEDHAAALMDRGLSPEEAEEQAILAMGDAGELGRAMDALYSSFWGCLLLWLHRALLLIVVLLLLLAAGRGSAALEEHRQRAAAIQHLEGQIGTEALSALADWSPGPVLSAGGYTLTAERAVLSGGEDRTLSLLLRVQHSPWLRDPAFLRSLAGEDDLGNRYRGWYPDYPAFWEMDVSSAPSSPFSTVCLVEVRSIPAEASTLTLFYDRGGYRVSFPLDLKGGVAP